MTIVEAAVSSADWDEAVANFPDASVYQTSSWALARSTRSSTRRIAIRDGGELAAGAQVLIRRVGPGATAGYVPYGPLVAEHRWHDADLVERVVAAIEAEAHDAGCAVLLIQPSRRHHAAIPILEGRGYRPAPVAVATTAAVEVELGRPDDELFAGLSKKRRSAVRRSIASGVVVERGGAADLVTFHRLHVASARHHGFLPMSIDYLHRQWRALHRHGYLQLFLARVDSEVRAAGTLLGYGPGAEFKLTGWDQSDEARRGFANEAVNWAMMSWANGAGHRYFDLGGLPRAQAVAAVESGDARAAIQGTGSVFKLGWGGRVVVYPDTYEKVLRRSGHLTYRLPSKLLSDGGMGGSLVNWMRRT
ncbi:MAG: lipid II:glycine glycyltransferase FemX [Acidimicrobiales bacterium]